LGMIAGGGFLASLTRFIAIHRVDRREGALRGTLRVGIGIPFAAAILLGSSLWIASAWLARSVLHDPGVRMPLELAAGSLPFYVTYKVALAATQGYKAMRHYALNLALEPMLRLALSAVLIAIGLGCWGALPGLVV